MRTTLRIEEDLLDEIRAKAHRERVSITRLMGRLLRQGLAEAGKPRRGRRPYRQRSYAMGKPRVDLDHALELAAAMEDGEVAEKLGRGK